jgi:hypothetical protein
MANEFVIKNGYFSQGSSNVTGSLRVSGSIGVIGSGSDVLSVYGSQGNLLVTTDTFSGSIFTVSDISGYPILDITSDYYTSSVYLPTLQSQSQQNVVVYDSQSGLLSYVTASAFGGGGSPITFNSTSSFIGDGINTTYTITHGFNTKNLHITVYETSSNGETVYPDIRRNGLNTAQIVFANPPSSASYVVYISQ